MSVIRQGTFVHSLGQKDRDILRRVVKRVHMAHFPLDFVTDYEADKMVEVMMPETIEAMIRMGRDSDT